MTTVITVKGVAISFAKNRAAFCVGWRWLRGSVDTTNEAAEFAASRGTKKMQFGDV